MGIKKFIRRHRQQENHHSDGGDTTVNKTGGNSNKVMFVPSKHTLTSLKANKSKGYKFTVQKNSYWDGGNSSNNTAKVENENVIKGDTEFGNRKFVSVDKTRCLLTNKGKTEAILLHNHQKQTIHICSFTPPPGYDHNLDNGNDGKPLFEWGVVRKSKKKRSNNNENGYTMKTPYGGDNNGSYAVRGVSTETKNDCNIEMKEQKNIINKFAVTLSTTEKDDDDQICASFHETENSWVCHTMYGIDPAMMLCFVVALDTLRTIKKKRSGSIINLGSSLSLVRGGSSSRILGRRMTTTGRNSSKQSLVQDHHNHHQQQQQQSSNKNVIGLLSSSTTTSISSSTRRRLVNNSNCDGRDCSFRNGKVQGSATSSVKHTPTVGGRSEYYRPPSVTSFIHNARAA